MSQRPSSHVRETDAFTMRMERDPQLRSTIAAVAVFDRCPTWEVLVDRIDRATRLVPSFRSRLAASPFGLAPPKWVLDPEFDIAWHLRQEACPPHTTVEDILERAQVTAMTAFDPARSPWRFTLFHGLNDGRAALLMKVHHSLTDGIGGIELAAHVVDFSREHQDLGALPPPPKAVPRRLGDDLTEAASFSARRWGDLAATALRRLPGGLARSTRHPSELVADVSTTAVSLARFLRPVTTTRSPVMTERSLSRRFSRLDLDLPGLRVAAAAGDATLNDAFLAGILGGMRRYHLHHGAPVDSLRLTLPISVRQPGDAIAGNRVTLARIEVPIGVDDPLERMKAIGEIVRRARDDPALRYSEAIASVLNLLPPGVTGSMLKHIDLVATNVPGFADSIYVGGALVEAFYPYAPTIGAAANIGLLSYRDRCHVGVSSDPAAIADPGVFVECLAAGFDEVVTAGAG